MAGGQGGADPRTVSGNGVVMGNEIAWPDWGDGDHEMIPTNQIAAAPGQEAEGERILAEMEAWPNVPSADLSDHKPGLFADPTANMSEQQVGAAQYVAEKLLADAPAGFANTATLCLSMCSERLSR
jgi:hypothetical protein